MKQRNAKLYHLMDGLLYPAVVGTGLVVLLMRLVVGSTDTAYWERIALGTMTLSIYCASYVAFKDVKEDAYSLRIFLADVGEVALVFLCFWTLGLLEPRDTKPIGYAGFFTSITADILVVQPAWRGLALRTNGWQDSAFHRYWVRLGLVVLIAAGFFWPALRIVVGIIGIVLVLIHEFVWRTL